MATLAEPTASGAAASAPQPIDTFFFAAEARNDRWRDLMAAARAWDAANASATSHANVTRLFGEITPLEDYWAYPGLTLMRSLKEALDAQNKGVFLRLAQKVGRALISGNFRYEVSAWDPLQDTQVQGGDFMPPDLQGVDHKPYFEVLVVTPNDPAGWEDARKQMQRLHRREDPFNYQIIQVGSFEDAAMALVTNHNIQAVVLYDGFVFPSRRNIPLLHDHITRYAGDQLRAAADESKGLGTALAALAKKFRPELDIYLLTDRAVETLAGSAEVACIRRIFFDVEELLEIHLSIVDGVADRYRAPYFSNLVGYSQRPIGTFHALPIARGKSVFRSNWIRDMGQFYGTNIFLAESSATTGGLDSLLEPTNNIKLAQDACARAFGAHRVYFATNGTSTSNKIVVQAICAPGDIVIVDRNCHKSHHYGFVLAGSQPLYVEAFPLTSYSMYGAVPLRTIKKALLDLRAEGKLDRVKIIDLTNCTFDGHMYNTRLVMEECLAIKPDLIFLWDEAWFGFARFSPLHRRRSAMGAAAALTEKYRDPAYRKVYADHAAKIAKMDPNDPKLLDMKLLPDPDKVRIRAYQTNSTHKSMSAFRQGSMMLIWDEDFRKVEGTFQEAFLAHTSTSPNLQLIASLDIARRQMELEGYELTMRMTGLAIELRRQINTHPLISKYFRIATPEDMIPAEYRKSGLKDYGPPHSSWADVVKAWDEDEFALDPTRITLLCGDAGFDGTQFKGLLAERFDIQINKTSRNSILVQININNTRGDGAHLIKALVELSREIDERLRKDGKPAQEAHAARVKSLTLDVPDLPDFRAFHEAFRENDKSATSEGHMREAFFMAYDENKCEYVKLAAKEIDERLKNGPPLVSANFVIPYPPGFPIMVPGQLITEGIITFMRKLDVKEIHGYNAGLGLKLLRPDVLSGGKAGKAGKK
ncbi:MAG: decarboxylase [Alphaproteobacteria bacterium]|nr:decarboxylase [Alphaproteobacteria bacterium]